MTAGIPVFRRGILTNYRGSMSKLKIWLVSLIIETKINYDPILTCLENKGKISFIGKYMDNFLGKDLDLLA